MFDEQENLVERFDTDDDGKLNDEERKAAREYAKSRMGNRRGGPRFRDEATERTPGEKVDLADMNAPINYNPDADLYDETVLRTLYLQFPNEDWYEELEDFYRTGVEVPADLTVDGVTYKSVGVRFRGNSSYTMSSEKKPINTDISHFCVYPSNHRR
jgi:hypothetical protein